MSDSGSATDEETLTPAKVEEAGSDREGVEGELPKEEGKDQEQQGVDVGSREDGASEAEVSSDNGTTTGDETETKQDGDEKEPYGGKPPKSDGGEEREKHEGDTGRVDDTVEGEEPSRPASSASYGDEWLVMVLRKVVGGETNGLQECLRDAEEEWAAADLQRQLSAAVDWKGVRGPLLHHAVHAHRKRCTSLLYDATRDADVRRDAVFLAVRHCKYDMALLLLSKEGTDVNYQRESDGNAILHCACSRQKPPVVFIAELCKLRSLRVNAVNHAGLTPVHLLAVNSIGVEGRDACQLLKAKGALLDKPSPSGATALQLTRNSFLRECLSLSSSYRRRQNPLELLPKEEIEHMDRLPLQKLPALKKQPCGVPAPGALSHRAAPSTPPDDRSKLRRRMRINPEEEGELVNRLYTQALQKQEDAFKELAKKHLTPLSASPGGAGNRKLSPDEQEESIERLFAASRDHQEEKLSALLERYVPPLTYRSISPEDLRESVSRLYSSSVEKSREKRLQLAAKYYPGSLVSVQCGGRTITAEERAGLAARLHDQALVKQKETLHRLQGLYLVSNKAKKTMTDEEWRSMGERLCRTKNG